MTSARKSETETFGIVGRFHKFKDWAPTSVHRVNVYTFPDTQHKKKKKIKKKTKQNKPNQNKTKTNLHLE